MHHVEPVRHRGVVAVVGLALVVLCVCGWLWGGRRALTPTSADGSSSTRETSLQGWDGAHDSPSGDGTQPVVWTEEGGVEQVATRLLATYRDGEPCVLCQAGYIDLVGDAWSCVVQGAGWVDICVVRQGDGASTVSVMRLEADQVAAELGDGE